MKKVDKIVFGSFIGPFILTMLVVIFILLTQHMLKYFDDLVGKDLGWSVIGQLMMHFAIFVSPSAFPLAILLSSLMTFGNLGEHSELTAIKSGGISLPRAMRSIFIFSIFLTGVAFISNNYLVPRSALEAYSLMWDIKRKKPSLDLPEGEFYGGLNSFSIRVEEKMKDGQTLKGVIVYDHSNRNGNTEVTLADSGRMTTIMDERYLKMELFNGHSYLEGTSNKGTMSSNRKNLKNAFSKVKFATSEMIFDLESFDLERTDKELFSRNRLMRGLKEIETDIDSIEYRRLGRVMDFFYSYSAIFSYHMRDNPPQLTPELQDYKNLLDSLSLLDDPADSSWVDDEEVSDSAATTTTIRTKPAVPRISENFKAQIQVLQKDPGSKRQELPKVEMPPEKQAKVMALVDEIDESEEELKMVVDHALHKIRQAKARVEGDVNFLNSADFETRVYLIQYHKIIAYSFACMVMVLIGASLGSIIKKGGLGVPVLVSILFFIIYYVFTMTGEKWAKKDLVYPWAGIWSANILLLPIGLFFLRQARKDARLFDLDFYHVILLRIRNWFARKK
ncbi:MAG: LptF/LptG family permease [Cyclobacteriaceae bacterium]|nr:LptF/LptG family permease [Cyclobacteriaceae bacterium]